MTPWEYGRNNYYNNYDRRGGRSSGGGGTQNGDWDCLAPSCCAMRKFGKGNRQSNWHCFLCGTKRPTPAAPTPKELADAKAEASGEKPKTPAAASKRQLRRDKKAKAKADAEKAEGWEGFVDETKPDDDDEVIEVKPPRTATQGAAQGTPAAKAAGVSLGSQPALSAAEKERLIALGLQVVPPKVSFKGRYPIPTKLTLGTPKETVAASMAGNASVKAAALKEAVGKQTKAVELAVDSFGSKHQITVLAKAELVKTKEELVSVSEHAPPPVSKAAAQKIARALRKAKDHHAERLQKDQTGMEKADAKFAADRQCLRDAIEELEGRIENLCDARTASQEAWLSRMQSIATHETEVAREFKDQIALATPGGLEHDFDEDDGEDIKVDSIDEDLAKLKDLNICATNLLPSDIPKVVLEAAEPSQIVVLNALGAFFLSAPVCAPLPPVSYELLGVPDTAFVKNLVGDKVWKAFYKDRTVASSDWVPRQMVEIIRCCLNELGDQLAKRSDPDVFQAATAAAKERMVTAVAQANASTYCPF